MSTTLHMPELLERRGHRLRGKTRADCVNCSGHAIATISYTDEVAYCHRCQWKANTTTLKKELGLFETDPESKRKRRKEAQERAKHEASIARFEAWRELQIRRYSAELRQLGRGAMFARDVLVKYPECDDAWDSLARFCHQEGELNQLLDYLTCRKASPWLAEEPSVLDLFEGWKREIDGR